MTDCVGGGGGVNKLSVLLIPQQLKLNKKNKIKCPMTELMRVHDIFSFHG